MRFTIAFVHCCITNTQSKSSRVRTRPEGAAATFSRSASMKRARVSSTCVRGTCMYANHIHFTSKWITKPKMFYIFGRVWCTAFVLHSNENPSPDFLNLFWVCVTQRSLMIWLVLLQQQERGLWYSEVLLFRKNETNNMTDSLWLHFLFCAYIRSLNNWVLVFSLKCT